MNSVNVIGRGRVGSAVAARLEERGVELRATTRSSSCSACPTGRSPRSRRDRARAVGRARLGATPLAALEPHERLLRAPAADVHARPRAEQLDGAWAAVTARTTRRGASAGSSPTTLGLRPFDLDDGAATLYHAGAAIASNYLVTLYRAASRLFEDAGAPPEALVPLMTRTIENGFELTGPIARGDWAVVDATSARCTTRTRARADVPRARGGDAAVKITRTIAETRAPLATARGRARPDDGRLPRRATSRCSRRREENDVVVASLFVNPASSATARPRALPARRGPPTRRSPRRRASTSSSPRRRGAVPAGYETWVDVERARRASRATTARPLPRRSRPSA
jgi:predicted short-subunit dehydrogenase-like oxidoreductase (DUF2520 family)